MMMMFAHPEFQAPSHQWLRPGDSCCELPELFIYVCNLDATTVQCTNVGIDGLFCFIWIRLGLDAGIEEQLLSEKHPACFQCVDNVIFTSRGRLFVELMAVLQDLPSLNNCRAPC